MSSEIIGRAEELRALQWMYDSDEPEFLAVSGRRRVGKTFLISEFCQPRADWFFSVTGIPRGEYSAQRANFTQEIGRVFYAGAGLQVPNDWFAVFDLLRKSIDHYVQRDQKIVLFFDEFPWMVTHRSRLLMVFDHTWNQYWSHDSRIKLIISGSSASWITNKIINNRGGLHNRVTKRIHLYPFNLRESQDFLKTKGVELNQQQTVQLYMAVGGVPYYLELATKGLSVTELIEKLAFKKNSPLLNEFDNVLSSLFDKPEPYVELIRIIAKHRCINLEALAKSSKLLTSGGGISEKLNALERDGFIQSFLPHYNQKRGIYYRVVDEYSLFYLHWIEPVRKSLKHDSLAPGYWSGQRQSVAWKNWSGHAFESVCYKHLLQIREASKMAPGDIANVWRYVPKGHSQDQGAQVDLLFDRDDGAITLCEMIYSDTPYVIDKTYAEELMAKQAVFKEKTKTKKQLYWAMVAANGLQSNSYATDMITRVVTLEHLFA